MLGVFAAYLLAGRVGLAVPFTSGNVSPVWPPAGIALAAILIFGYRIWPAVALGAFTVNFFTDIPHIAAGAIAVGNTVGPLCGASLLRLLPSFQRSLIRLRDVLGLIICGALGGTAVSATVGAGVLFLTGVHAWSGFAPAWLVWWWGDAMGVLIVTPLAVTFTGLLHIHERRRLVEMGWLLLGAVGSSLLIFEPRLGFMRADAFAFGVFPFVLWGAIRFEAAGAAMVSCLISAVAVWGTAHGFGPFIKGNALQNATLLQSFLAVTSVSGIVLAAVIAERAQLIREQSSRETAELEKAKDAAESADRLKSAFLATMSHELRTPLNSIIGFTGIVCQGLAGPLNDEQKKRLGMVQNSARHLLALINDVLDISKIEAGQLEIHYAPFSITKAVRKAVNVVSPLAEKKGISLRAEFSPDVNGMVGDQRRTEQILLNLLGNAVKFTDYGEVSVRCVRDQQWLVTTIRGTGIGIDPRDHKAIFEPFHQADTGLARKHEGTGLGLSICKRLVERLGGSICVDSAPGQGSTFTVRLPLEAEGVS